MGFPGGSVVKNLSTNAGDTGDVGSNPGWGSSLEEEMTPILVFLPGNPMDRGVWWATVHRVTKSQT